MSKLSDDRDREAKLETKLAKQQKRKQTHKKGSPKRHAASLAIPRLKGLIGPLLDEIARLVRRKNRKRSATDALVQRYIAEADRCTNLGLHYVWGGGHGTTPTSHNGPWDCSSYASHLDQTVSSSVQTGTTFTLAEAGAGLEHGVGQHITHFIKNVPSSDAHVITRIVYRGRTRWTQCGGRDNTKSGDGPCWFTPTASRIREFPIQVHPTGL